MIFQLIETKSMLNYMSLQPNQSSLSNSPCSLKMPTSSPLLSLVFEQKQSIIKKLRGILINQQCPVDETTSTKQIKPSRQTITSTWQSREDLRQSTLGNELISVLQVIYNIMIIPELDVGIKSQTTTVVKGLTLTSGSCMHTNIVKVIRVEGETDEEAPQITTITKEEENHIIRHLTEIKFKNRNYIVQDVYVFSLNETKDPVHIRQARSFISSSHDSRNSSGSDSSKRRIKRRSGKKVCLFQKTGKLGHRYRKRNTKNIPKNFCKAFSNFMDDHPNKLSDEWSLAMKVLKKIESRDKYNNITMKKMMQNPRIAPFFKSFLQNYAEQWINNSKIADKKVHLEAIKIYLQLLGKLAYAQVDPSPSDEG